MNINQPLKEDNAFDEVIILLESWNLACNMNKHAKGFMTLNMIPYLAPQSGATNIIINMYCSLKIMMESHLPIK